MDVAAIKPGRDFRKAIDESVATCSVLLAVIGQEWLESKDESERRRLENPNDFVRIELSSALRRDIPVVPVLVRGAKMPQADQLPDDLKELAYRNALELTHARWKSDVEVLIRALRPCLDVPGEDDSAANGAAQAKEAAAHKPDAAVAVLAIDGPTIERIVKELALFIGPIAEVVVKRAAKRCVSVEDLCGTAAQEIESDAGRAKFLRACRS
jgi:TIR domain